MSTPQPLSFVPTELRSYLPSGWGLTTEGGGQWDRRRGTWSVEIYDAADTTWQLSVSAAEAAKLGRLEALRLAIDRVYREALG